MRVPDSRTATQSAASKTYTEDGSTFHKKLILTAQYGRFDFLFPLFDALTQETRIYNGIYYLQMILIILQFYLISMWPYTLNYLNNNDTYSNIIKRMTSFLVFIGDKDKEDNPIIYFAISSTIFVLLWFAFLIQYLSYRRKRVFSFPAMIWIRFVCECLLPFYIIPVFSNVGWLLQLIINKTSKYAIYYFFPSLIYSLFFFLMFDVTYTIFSVSPFLSRAPCATWEAKKWIKLVGANAFFGFLSSFVTNFPSATIPVVIVLHFLFMFYEVYNMYTFYFIKISTTTAYAAVLSGCAVVDIFSIVYYAMNGFPTMIYLIIIIPLYILGVIASRLTYKPLKARVVEILSLPDAEAQEEYEAAHIKTWAFRAKSYLHIGMLEMCDRFIDFSLIKYIVSYVDNIDVLAECLKIVCCFPQESRFMSQIFQGIIEKRDLPMSIRFLLYQTERIKAVRQCSSSVNSSELFAKLSATDNACFDEISSIWRHPPSSMAPIKKLNEMVSRAQNQWIEILNAYPNNSRFREEYSHFLVECKSDFTGGILQKYKTQQIEQGINFATDKAFKFFIANYPKYLKNNIIDCKGNILIFKQKRKGSSVSGSSSHGSMPLSSSNQLSDEMEQGIGKSMFNASKTRIGLQNAFYGRKSTPVKNFKTSAIIYFIIQIISIIAVYVLFEHTYEHDVYSISVVTNINNLRYAVDEGVLYCLVKWADKRNLIASPRPSYTDYDEEDVLFDADMDKNILLAKADFIESMQSLMAQMSGNALAGGKASQYVPSFVSNSEDVLEYFFKEMETTKNVSSNLQKSAVHLLSLFETIGNFGELDDFTADKNTHINEIIANKDVITKSSEEMISDMKQSMNREFKASTKKHYLSLIIFSILVYLLTVPALSIALRAVYKEQRTLLKLMKSFTETQIIECTQAVMLTSTNTASSSAIGVDNNEENHDSNASKYAFIILGGAIVPIIFSYGIIFSDKYKEEIYDAMDWIHLSSIRKPLLAESLTSLSLAILLGTASDTEYDPSSFKLTDKDKQFEIAKQRIDELITYNAILNIGNGTIAPCKNINDEIEKANVGSKCTIVNSNDHESHQFMECGSLTEIIDSFSTITLNEMKAMTKIGESKFLLISHSFFNHILADIDNSNKYIVEYGTNINHRQNLLMAINMCVSFAVAIAILIVFMFSASNLRNLYDTLLHLLLRMNPTMIVSNQQVISFLLKTEADNESTGSMTTARKIIHHSSDPIICLGGNEAVELINKATTTLLGYTPEQVLGQGIAAFFDTQSCEEVQKQIAMMKQNQTAMTYESHVTCITDSDSPIDCKLTLIGMGRKDSNSGATSYVIIVSDEGELVEGKRKAEEAKQKSETLLYHILPMDIVLRINRGESNISFSVPSATIIFIDIQRFSDYASSMSPSQIMGALSLMFGSFDDLLSKYPIIIKIKLIGDIYMAAGGLFAPNEPPQKHAEACVKFAIDVLQDLDDINNRLSSNLNVRIGINTGGPLIAGVLGTDKPVFDIIGDPINVASRLQSTDIVGRIQISQDTFDLINSSEYGVEKRNDVFLKGKGKSTAYLISPPSALSFSLSGSIHHMKQIAGEDAASTNIV